MAYAGIGSTQPIFESGPGAEISPDGLHSVDPSLMPAAWVRPDVDLSDYTRIFFMPAIVQFRDFGNRQVDQRRFETSSEFPVSETLQARVIETFGESFHNDISRGRPYELSAELGRDVLMVQGFLTDVISGIPPSVAGSNVETIRWVYETNIIMELRDSMSNEILARTIDHQRVDGPVHADAVYAMTFSISRSWSTLLVTRLRELASYYPSRLRRLRDSSEE